MTPATISLAALLAAILLSCFARVNIGILALLLAWAVGVGAAGMTLKQVASGFPIELFLTMTGVTLLFTQARINGTLDHVARRSVRLCRGRVGLIPVMFFFLGAVLATLGPGNIAVAALLAPIAMSVAGEFGIPAFLMAIMVGNGANSGSLSPFAPTGIIVNSLMERIGLAGHEWFTWWYCFSGHAVVAFAGYAVLGGLRLLRQPRSAEVETTDTPFDWRHVLTLAVIVTMLAAVAFARAPIGMAAIAGALVLVFARAADDGEAIKQMPWSTILMVCGMTVLISILERTAGIDLLASLMARVSTPTSAPGVCAFITGLISAYSSTSGVVLPAFLPVVPSLVRELGGGDAFFIATSMNVGGHLVDVSPLSTIGALCIASAAKDVDTRRLFHAMLAWGMSMTVIGAILCWLFLR
ncbi:MAG: C4-dicarboxylate ABC transporter [Bryobacterales bacterium]|nr:C4-dicarboxylate ABC transporter [Bryobacterales bacterium]